MNNSIIEKRQKGYSLLQLYKHHQSFEPYLDEIICLVHVVRVCHENNLPFTQSQIKRVGNKLYSKEAHGTKGAYLQFINQWSGRCLLKFKADRPHPNQLAGKKIQVSEKPCSRPPFSEKLAPRTCDLGLNDNIHHLTQSGAKKGLKSLEVKE